VHYVGVSITLGNTLHPNLPLDSNSTDSNSALKGAPLYVTNAYQSTSYTTQAIILSGRPTLILCKYSHRDSELQFLKEIMSGAQCEMPSKPNSLDCEASMRYWGAQLHGAKQATFPSRRPTPVIRSLAKNIAFPPLASSSSVTKAIILRAAWAIVLGRYCDTDDVCFGASVSSPESVMSAGPLVVPVRLYLDPEQTVADFLRDVQAHASAMIPHEQQFALQNVTKLVGEDAQAACDFSSLLVVRMADSIMAPPAVMTGYLLVILLHENHDIVQLSATYDSGLLADAQVTALSHHFDCVVQQLLSPGKTGTLLRDMSLAGEWDLQRAIGTNANIPEAVDDCVHHMIERQARQRPDAPAICAWDGNLTYGQLNAAANRLVRRLFGKVSAEVLVHVCFEKSVWFFVSILAINKAGGAWIPLDPSHPTQRHQELIHQTKAELALTSTANVEICKSLGLAVIEVTAALDKALVDEEGRPVSPSVSSSQLPATCEVTSQNAAYILFTSGSTGTPKGLLITHGSLCTSQVSLGISLSLTTETRFLQFASYVFDSCIAEIIATLLFGGCVCVPADEMRWTGIPGFIHDTHVNSALLTPSFIRTVKPSDVPSLRLLITASESPGRDMLNTWLGHVRLFNAWGPAEICCIATLHEWKSFSESPMTVGRPVGGSCSWIVDPENHERLTPIGCVGELVVQGPTILREYLSNRKKTEESIITPVPAWMPCRRLKPEWNRFFKTGDLGFYNPDGTIEFVGRKDTQVKIRGQRVELEEVEFNIRTILEPKGIKQVAVDTLRTETRTSLVAYLCFNWDIKRAGRDRRDNMDDLFLPMTDEVKRLTLDLAKELRVKLPSYMVPTMFVPCRYMPYSTKLERKTLRQKTTVLDKDNIARYSLVDSKKQAPKTALETQMQQLWASILKIPAESIGRDDNFLQIGGDSISAIRLVSVARSSHGIALTMGSIFEDARLWCLAAIAGSAADVGVPLPPFSLLPEGRNDEILDQALRHCGLSGNQAIEDAYPCTPLQEGLMALAAKQPSSYLTTWVYKLCPHADATRFKDAWEQTMALCDSLRTRIILADSGSFQIVLKNDVAWEAWESPGGGRTDAAVDLAVEETHKTEISLGSRLWRYALTEGADRQRYFTLIGHHAIFDGWSIGLIMQQLQRLYQETTVPALEPFSRFIQYVGGLDREASERYWTAQLHEAKQAAFPPRKAGVPNTTGGSVLRTLTNSTALPPSASPVTKATVLRAAWAIVLARYCETDDVCFGASVSGRHAPVPGVESVSGPLVATLPVRLRLDPEQKVTNFLRHVQVHASNMTPHEQFGLQNMMKLGQNAREACDFTSVLVIHPIEILDGFHAVNSIMVPVIRTGMVSAYEYFGYPLVVHAFLRKNDVELVAKYNTAWMVETQVTALYHHIDHVVQQLLTPGETLLRDVSLAGPWDLQQATVWNQEGPEAIDDCLHYMITRQVQKQPDAPAICAWDGELTYNELDAAADRLARYLVKEQGVIIEDFVHVCFEKSVWFYVAILAISKAGGAWVPLDPSHPTQRQQEIVRQTGARLTLTSAANVKRCVGPAVIEVTAALDKALIDNEARTESQSQLPLVTSQNAAYVLFTSGSTGTPKGLVMEHGSVCTNMVAIAARLDLKSDIRMLQFASYAFDAFVFESICFLISGACICVPSETARLTNLEEFINTTAVNWADLTPTFARTIDSNKIQKLQCLVVGGEPAGQDTIKKWVGNKTRLINVWGPAETCVISACHEYKFVNESPQTIGRPLGGSCWIVEPGDHKRLTPIGCVGEIVVQGPAVLREYLADQKRTEAAIKAVPAWMPRSTEVNYDRLYKTGDLAFYNPDGTIEFICRKDLQVKIRGQRVELGEVEHNIQTTLDGIEQVAVDVSLTEARGVSLVAYLCFNRETSLAGRNNGHAAIHGNSVNGTNQVNGVHEVNRAHDFGMDNLFLPLTDQMEKQVRRLAKELRGKLPEYMVPTMFIPCRYMPFITTTKLDRKKLRQKTAELNRESIARYSLVECGKKQPPGTAEEVQMQQLWASVLKVPAETIGRDDSFLQIGGDSITAIRLVLLARGHGITLTVPSIFQDARLSRLAAISGAVQ
jgi:amino acid adenylation domain-containing protein